VLAAEKNRGARSVGYADALADLADTLMKESQWSAAEPHLLECIALLQSLAASAAPLAATADTAEAVVHRLQEAMGLAVQLYAAWGKSAESFRWQRELNEAEASR